MNEYKQIHGEESEVVSDEDGESGEQRVGGEIGEIDEKGKDYGGVEKQC